MSDVSCCVGCNRPVPLYADELILLASAARCGTLDVGDKAFRGHARALVRMGYLIVSGRRGYQLTERGMARLEQEKARSAA